MSFFRLLCSNDFSVAPLTDQFAAFSRRSASSSSSLPSLSPGDSRSPLSESGVILSSSTCGAMAGGFHCAIPRGGFSERRRDKPLPPWGEIPYERPGRMVHHPYLLSPTTGCIALVKLGWLVAMGCIPLVALG